MRFAPLTLALLMVGSGLAGAGGHHCAMSGEMKRSCCGSRNEAAEHHGSCIDNDASCCERGALKVDRLPPAVSAPAPQAAPAPSLRLSAGEIPAPAAQVVRAPLRARAPPGSKAPLFALKSVYLI